MEINGEVLFNVARCPKCNAICLEGNDDDCQIYCSSCGNSFIPKEMLKVDVNKLFSNPDLICTRDLGWTSFKEK